MPDLRRDHRSAAATAARMTSSSWPKVQISSRFCRSARCTTAAAADRLPVALLPVDLAIGACLVAAVGAATAFAPPRHERARLAGWLLVAIPLPLAVGLHIVRAVTGIPDQALFACGAVAFAVGAFLVLGSDGGGLSRGRDDDPDPAWWPDFEEPFRAYVKNASRRRERVTTR